MGATRRAICGTLLVLLLPAAAGAQRQASTSPEGAMRALLDAVAAQRWRDAAALLDLGAFDRWRRAQLEVARRPQPPRRLTAEELMRSDPAMPREVAEYHARQANAMRERSAARPYLLDEFAEVPSLDSLARLSARDAAARWLHARDPRWLGPRELEGLRRSGCQADSAALAAARRETPPDSHAVVGALRRGDTAFVVLQEVLRHPAEFGREQDDRILSPRAVRMRRTGAGWVLVDWEDWFRGGAVSFLTSCDR